MGIFDSWKPVTSLTPGADYRAEYAVVCAGIENAGLVALLDAQGIVTAAPNVGGLIASTLANSKMDFRVKAAMSASEFHGRLVAAFAAASDSVWTACNTPDVKGLYQMEQGGGPGSVFQPFAGGAVFALVVVFVLAVVIVWKAD